jgi:hypothetical protein
MWVIEDDTAFVGDIRAALTAYRDHKADLVSVMLPHPYIDNQWWLYVNRGFGALFPGPPVHKWEHVERYSSALLLKLEQLLRRGAAAYGEVFASTVCARMSWCAPISSLVHVRRRCLTVVLHQFVFARQVSSHRLERRPVG